MQNVGFYETVKRIMYKDRRYHFDSYAFVNDAVIYTVKKFESQRSTGESKHVSGEELIVGVLEYATKMFGPLAYEVFCEWNIKDGISIGNVVFNMLEFGLLSKTEEDSIDDFNITTNFEKSLSAQFIAPSCFDKDQIQIIA